MHDTAMKLEQHFTWTDYRTWPDEERWELVGGEAFAMSPSPTSRHQDIVSGLTAAARPFFQGKPCRLFVSPMDVKLSEEDVVQPDLLVVCKPEQIKRTHIEGPPSLVVEVLSETSLKHDRHTKRDLYARFGVREYWIVTPFPGLVEIMVLRDGLYTCWKSFVKEDTLVSASFPEVTFPLAPIFDFPLEEHEKELLRVKEPPARYRTIAEA
ncbi:MAG: Uma2 family endonuclease [Lentisphaerota bacterium]